MGAGPTSDEQALDIELSVAFRGERVVVAVSGELDILTTGVLVGALNAVVDAGHRDLIVDVGGVTFIGAAGVGVFAGVLLRVSAMSGTITLRSTPEQFRRVLDITGMSDLFGFAESVASTQQVRGIHDGVPHEGAEEGELDLAASGSSAPPRSSTGVVDAALGLVTTLAASPVGNADGVSVTLERHGR